jgi:hypothetical protein
VALPVHLVIEELGPGAGAPQTRIEMAVRRLDQLRNKRTAPAERSALRDFDQAEANVPRADRARHQD